MSFLLKVISFPSQTEQSSGPRRLGNLFHKTDSLASIQSLSTPQPRRTNKSFSDAAPDTLRCMFHCFIPASVLFASCSKKKKRSRKHIEKYDETCEDVKFINHNLIWKLQKKCPHQICYFSGWTWPCFWKGQYIWATIGHFVVLCSVLPAMWLWKTWQRLW